MLTVSVENPECFADFFNGITWRLRQLFDDLSQLIQVESVVSWKNTRKYLWNTSRPQNSMGYGYLYILNIFAMKTAIFGQFENIFGRVYLTEMVKRHICGPKPLIWAYNQVSMTFRSKVLARTKKYDGQTDRQTDGHPKPIGPQPFGLGPNQTVKMPIS